jgi:DNA-binding response OmpR family regulator
LKRIVVAEDEPSIVLSLEFLLTEAGYEVLTAVNGADALKLVDQHKPDLLVLDIMLPVVNGFEVCRTVRSNPASREMPILMLTARGREQEIARGLAMGANAYVTKPFGTRELMSTIRELLGTNGPGQAP